MLVVVKDRDVQFAFQFVLHLETTRGADILEVDRPEPGRNPAGGEDDLLGIFGVETDRVGIDIGKFLEQHRLAFHDRQGGCRPDIPEPEHRRSVADHGHGVFLDRELAHPLRRLGNGGADARHAGRVRHRQRVPGIDRYRVADADLAALVHLEHPVGHVQHRHPAQPIDRGHDLAGMLVVAGVDGDLADLVLVIDLNQVDRSRVALGLGNRFHDPGQHPEPVGIPHAHAETVTDTRGNLGLGHGKYPVGNPVRTTGHHEPAAGADSVEVIATILSLLVRSRRQPIVVRIRSGKDFPAGERRIG